MGGGGAPSLTLLLDNVDCEAPPWEGLKTLTEELEYLEALDEAAQAQG